MLFIYTFLLRCFYAIAPVIGLFSGRLEHWRTSSKRWKSDVASFQKAKKLAWFHCASVGEFEQAIPVIEALHEDYQIAVTFFSPSGYEAKHNYKKAELITYLPLDLPSNVHAFLDGLKPDIAVFVKYELWFNFMDQINRRDIPMLLISAHFPKNHWTVSWPGSLLGRRLNQFDHIFAQDETTQRTLEKAGVTTCSVVGDTRMDRVMAIKNDPLAHEGLAAFRDSTPQRLIIGSAWESDEEVLWPALEEFPDVKAIVAPHNLSDTHLKRWRERFGEEMLLIDEATKESASKARIIYVDKTGLLSRLYAFGTMAYVGGGFGRAVHNTLEAVVWGIPVAFGPANERFLEIQELKREGLGFEVRNQMELIAALQQMMSTQQRYSELAKSFFASRKGAADKIVGYIRERELA